MTVTAPTAEQKVALSALQAQLESRRSVLHFAHAAVSIILGLIGSGTVAKIYWDLDIRPDTEFLVLPVALLSASFFVYGAVRYVIGRRVLKVELVRFAELKVLHQQLNLEDPSALLPR